MEIYNLKLTKHALNRSQQRGIKKWAIDFIINHADIFRKTRQGAESCFISKKKISSLISENRLKASDAEKITNLVIIECSGRILTTFKSSRALNSI